MKRLFLLVFVLLATCTPKKEAPKSVAPPLLPPGIVVRESPPDSLSPRERAMARVAKMKAAQAAAPKPKAVPAAPSTLPPSWTVPDWYIDASNATGCASDQNSGTSATCAANHVGPLRSWQELNVKRWGCQGSPSACPRLTQNTTIHFLSDEVSPSDPIVFLPSVENGTYTTIECALGSAQEVGKGTLGTVTPKNRPANQALETTFVPADGGGGTIAPYQLIYDSTPARGSYAWVNRLDTAKWLMTQPIGAVTLPVTATMYPYMLAEDDGWTSGDHYIAYNLVSLYATHISAASVNLDSNASSGLYVHHCNLALSSATFSLESPVILGDFTYLIESTTTTGSVIWSAGTTGTWGLAVNALFSGNATMLASQNTGIVLLNGMPANFTQTPILGGASLSSIDGMGAASVFDFDFQFTGGNVWPNVNFLSATGEADLSEVFVDTSVTLYNYGIVANEFLSPSTVIYGPGNIVLEPSSTLSWKPSVGFAATFPLAGGISLGNRYSTFTLLDSPAIVGGSSFVGDGGTTGALIGHLTTTGDAGVRTASLLYPLPGSGAAIPGSVQAVPANGTAELASRVHCWADAGASPLSARWTLDQGWSVATAGKPQSEGPAVTALSAGSQDGGVPPGWAASVVTADGGLFARLLVTGDPKYSTSCFVQTEMGYGH